VADVALLADGVVVARFIEAPYQATYHVPGSAPAGLPIALEARATDFAGLQASDAGSTTVVDTPPGEGVLTGEVYDDASGLALPGASIALVGHDAAGTAYAATTQSDARGRYLLRAAAGDAIVRIGKTGWTHVDRPLTIASGAAVELFDARLTPSGAATSAIAPVLGGRVQAGGASIDVPPGAVAAPTSLTLTAVGPQGLRALLPPGWSPVAAVDVAPEGVAFAAPATLRAPRGTTPSGTALVLVTWDAEHAGWRVEAETAAGETSALEAAVGASGQYAWLRADTAPVTPPAAPVGELLAGVPVPSVPESLQAVVEPKPQVLFYAPGVRSAVTDRFQLDAPVSSGARLWARISESYSFFSKAEIRLEPSVQDLVFYQTSAEGTSLAAQHTVSPSMTFEALSLEKGIISVDLIAPPEEAGVHVVDRDGGDVSLPTGERLEVPAGLTETPLAVKLTPLAAGEIGAALPTGFERLGSVLVSLTGGVLSGSAVVSIPRPSGLAEAAQILLARADTIQGQTRLVLVGQGRVDGDRVVSVARLPRNQIPFEGVRVGGRYVFLRPVAPVGFVAGQVLGATGTAFAGALVSTDSVPLVALSRVPGGYVAAAGFGRRASVRARPRQVGHRIRPDHDPCRGRRDGPGPAARGPAPARRLREPGAGSHQRPLVQSDRGALLGAHRSRVGDGSPRQQCAPHGRGRDPRRADAELLREQHAADPSAGAAAGAGRGLHADRREGEGPLRLRDGGAGRGAVPDARHDGTPAPGRGRREGDDPRRRQHDDHGHPGRRGAARHRQHREHHARNVHARPPRSEPRVPRDRGGLGRGRPEAEDRGSGGERAGHSDRPFLTDERRRQRIRGGR
jgi:hypothetical protein